MNEAKVKRFGQNNAKHLIWICFYTPSNQNLIWSVKHAGENILVWGCFATSGQETFGAIEATTNLKLYEEIMQENVGGEA